jgi:hypothetical protein
MESSWHDWAEVEVDPYAVASRSLWPSGSVSFDELSRG